MNTEQPSMVIFGLKGQGSKFFLPHYLTLHELYQSSRIVQLDAKSVMFTKEALAGLDFWSLDSDFMFAEDMLSFTDMLNYSGNYFDYFSEFMKVYRVAHSLFETESMLSEVWTKNKSHVLDIYLNMMASEVVMISPVLEDIFRRVLPEFFSKKALGVLRKKFLVLPPPDLYKLTRVREPKSFKKLVFLWNHRFNEVKNYKLFFKIIEDFWIEHPEVPLEIMILSLNNETEVMRLVPRSLHPFIRYYPFIYDKEEYNKVVSKANITIGTSKVESFGISVFDAVKRGLVVLNMDCNWAFKFIVGEGSTFTTRTITEAIYKVWKSQAFRDKINRVNLEGLSRLPNKAQYKRMLTERLNEELQARLDKCAGRSEKVAMVMKKLERGALTKQQVYEAMGWKSTGSILNRFWGNYYYTLRKLGVRATYKDGKVWFHVGDLNVKEEQPRTTPPKGLFS